MTNINFDELRSPRAIVCKRQHRADCGVGLVWYVCLADGWLLDCGAENGSEARAHILAEVINAERPEAFHLENLTAWRPA